MRTLLAIIVLYLIYRWWLNNTVAGANFGDKAFRFFNPKDQPVPNWVKSINKVTG